MRRYLKFFISLCHTGFNTSSLDQTYWSIISFGTWCHSIWHASQGRSWNGCGKLHHRAQCYHLSKKAFASELTLSWRLDTCLWVFLKQMYIFIYTHIHISSNIHGEKFRDAKLSLACNEPDIECASHRTSTTTSSMYQKLVNVESFICKTTSSQPKLQLN